MLEKHVASIYSWDFLETVEFGRPYRGMVKKNKGVGIVPFLRGVLPWGCTICINLSSPS
jgi:hypothetical protein